jgi:hypothetical protein
MAMTKQECRLLRVVVNRALLGPAWFNDTAGLPMVYELRHQTREWLLANVVRELNQMLPADERVSVDGIRATLRQVPGHGPATEFAALATQESIAHPSNGSGPHPAEPTPADQAHPQSTEPESAPRPHEVEPERNPWPPMPDSQCSACGYGVMYCACSLA